MKHQRTASLVVLIAWVGCVTLAVTGAAGFGLVIGSWSYMGSSDLAALKTAVHLYGPDIGLLCRSALFVGSATLVVLTAPVALALAFMRRPRRQRDVLAATLAGALLWFLWISVACLRVPTLFSEIYYRDGRGLSAALMRLICSRPGVWLVVLGWLAVLAIIRGLAGARAAFASGLAFATGAVWLWSSTLASPPVVLPPGSVVLLVIDSLRSDAFTEEKVPRLFHAAQANDAVITRAVVPPIARTTPAVISLLTGKLPSQTRVTSMFSSEATFKQIPSLASAFRSAGVCTVAVGEYPAEMLKKYELGFEQLDVPRVRFKEIALQAMMTRNALLLATLSWAPLRALAGVRLSNLFEGLPTFADPKRLVRKLASSVHACGERPVFAFVFADQPHFPYVQTWPFYLRKGRSYSGPYKWAKDPYSTAGKPEDRRRIRELYDTSLLASESALGQFVAQIAASGQLSQSTVILTGDHGESLYDELGIMGHGDQLGEMAGISVPWVVWGRSRDSFAFPGRELVESTEMTPRLLALRGLPALAASGLPTGMIYVETDLWLADTPNVPRTRVSYPELTQLLTIKNSEAQIELKPEWVSYVEFAKHRMWILGADRYTLEPMANRVLVTHNGLPIPSSELPQQVVDFLRAQVPDVARATLP